MAGGLKVSRVQKKGQVTIPSEIRERLGVQEGDLIAFIETSAGVLLSPQVVVPSAPRVYGPASEDGSGFQFEQFINFAQRLAQPPGRTPTPAQATQSPVEMTYGIFAPRRQPEDFAELRQAFIAGVAHNAASTAYSDPG